ncbi:MAG: hypothetical protein HOJ25_04305, partial [Candidatus Magasanikbacteria bacterium]|nr:hypothetical protein [Candidatus Magasanikbacteria bacterium]
FIFDNKIYEVEVRYRGNSAPHWSEEKKSMRIRFPKDDLFFGKRDINFIIPLDRYYLAEEFNNYRARKMGLVVPDSKFVGIKINGKQEALYWEVEHFSKEFLETHNLSGDMDLYGEGDTFQQKIYTDINYWQKYVEDPLKAKNNYTPLEIYLSFLNEAPEEVFNKYIFDLIDKDNFYTWTIHNLLSGSLHQDYSHNIRMVFDKSVGKFKIFPWDLYVYDYSVKVLDIDSALEATRNPLVGRVLSNPEFMHERNQMMWEYVENKDNLKEGLKTYDELFVSTQKTFYNDPIRNRSYKFFENEVGRTRSNIEKNFNRIRKLFTNGEASFVFSNKLHNNELELSLSNFNSVSPAYLSEIELTFKEETLVLFDVLFDGKKVCDANEAEIDEDKNRIKLKCDRLDIFPRLTKYVPDINDIEYYAKEIFVVQKNKNLFLLIPREQILLNDVEKIKIEVRNSNTDKKFDEVSGVFVDNTEFTNFYDISKTPQEFTSENKRFYLNGNEIVLPAGLHIFSDNLVIPRNTKLTILPGATINLINNASFVSYSPVIAKGNPSDNIIVRGEGDGVGENFAVLDNIGLSEFEYVEFSGGGESTVNGAFFSGMLAIHHADSIIKYCKFENAAGDDALNIKYASSTVAHNSFVANSADAIDYDFSNGVIEYNKFIDNGNDSIDTSGSPVLIQFNEIINSGDKCISSGEKSTSVIFNNILHGCYIGIEVKDLSEPTIINNVIVHNDIGINEYQKKEIFGGGKGRVYNTIIWDNKESIMLDKVSTIEVYNSDVESGYDGKGNFDKEPVFLEGFTNSEKDAIIKFKTGGNGDILKEVLGVGLDEVPVGLVYGFK